MPRVIRNKIVINSETGGLYHPDFMKHRENRKNEIRFASCITVMSEALSCLDKTRDCDSECCALTGRSLAMAVNKS